MIARNLRQTLTIARRDFTATVFTPVFLLFLFAPLIMGSFGAIGGLGAASVSDRDDSRTRIVAAVAADRQASVRATDVRLRRLFRDAEAPPELIVHPPADATALVKASDGAFVAALSGPLDRPQIAYAAGERRVADYLAAVAEQALQAGHGAPLSVATRHEVARTGRPIAARSQSAFFAVFGVFFLTLFLAGQMVGTMAEERNNKVIEVLAAAVPLESVFLGKLLGMFGVAVLFVAFWAAVLANLGALLPANAAQGLAELRPATGLPVFTALFAAYFAMAYLLLGSVFLSVGAQASTMREIQMLSLPITIVQVSMFALSSAAVSHPGSGLALFAEVFPLSSPFAMAGHAAASATLWPHAAALAWQALWVAIFVTIGARLFRRGVLQSGSAASPWKKLFRRSTRAGGRRPVDTAVS
jgi:ABC-2 type transport system permease protein